MGTTTLWGLRYPGSADEPNVPVDMQELADDADSALGRALAIANAAARPASPARGALVHQDDDDTFYGYTGSLWVPLSGSGGGGGGGSAGGRWEASGAGQPIPNTASGPGTIVAFGDVGSLFTPTQVTRTSEGAGHKFELLAAGKWDADATIRMVTSTAAGEVSAGIYADPAGGSDFSVNLAHDGGRREGLPRTLNPSGGTYLPAGTKIVVYVYNGTGTTRTLEPSSGAWVHLDLWLVG